MKAVRSRGSTLIVLGGFAGTGKTTLARRLSSELGIARLASDTIGRAIRNSQGIKDAAVDAYWIAYDVLFTLCEEFFQSGVSTIVDTSMGWAFQWEQVDSLREQHPETRLVPIVLRCPREICVERIRERYLRNPTNYDPPELYTINPKVLKVWEFLERLDRTDVHFLDANQSQDVVYNEVMKVIRQC